MLVKKAEEALAALLKEFLYLEGSNCPKETEIKGKLKGFKEALQLARLVKEDRFQQGAGDAASRSGARDIKRPCICIL